MFSLGFSELVLILLIAFLVVGPKDLPKVARALGRGIRSMKRWVHDFTAETGLDETIGELKAGEKEWKSLIKDADPRSEIREAAREIDSAASEVRSQLREIPDEVKQLNK